MVMASLNQVMLIGRLGSDVDLKYSQGGSPFARLSVATDESYTGQDGTRIQKTEWHKVAVFGKQAENCGNFLHKGSLVYIEGNLATRKWRDSEGQDRYSTEIKAKRIIFLDGKDRNNERYESGSNNNGSYLDETPF